MKVNIFQYFERSGKNIWIDYNTEAVYFHVEGGCEIVPFDKSYKRWVSYSLLNFVPKGG